MGSRRGTAEAIARAAGTKPRKPKHGRVVVPLFRGEAYPRVVVYSGGTVEFDGTFTGDGIVDVVRTIVDCADRAGGEV